MKCNTSFKLLPVTFNNPNFILSNKKEESISIQRVKLCNSQHILSLLCYWYVYCTVSLFFFIFYIHFIVPVKGPAAKTQMNNHSMRPCLVAFHQCQHVLLTLNFHGQNSSFGKFDQYNNQENYSEISNSVFVRVGVIIVSNV